MNYANSTIKQKTIASSVISYLYEVITYKKEDLDCLKNKKGKWKPNTCHNICCAIFSLLETSVLLRCRRIPKMKK
jgi:hypothetical protein